MGALTDVLGLVEGAGDLPGEDGVHCAHQDQHDGIAEGDHVGGVLVRGADQHVVLASRVHVYCGGR